MYHSYNKTGFKVIKLNEFIIISISIQGIKERRLRPAMVSFLHHYLEKVTILL